MRRMFSPALSAHSQSKPSAKLVDAFLATYILWREEAATAETAYQAWTCSDYGDANRGYIAYAAALDREEAAARELRSCVERVSQA